MFILAYFFPSLVELFLNRRYTDYVSKDYSTLLYIEVDVWWEDTYSTEAVRLPIPRPPVAFTTWRDFYALFEHVRVPKKGRFFMNKILSWIRSILFRWPLWMQFIFCVLISLIVIFFVCCISSHENQDSVKMVNVNRSKTKKGKRKKKAEKKSGKPSWGIIKRRNRHSSSDNLIPLLSQNKDMHMLVKRIVYKVLYCSSIISLLDSYLLLTKP